MKKAAFISLVTLAVVCMQAQTNSPYTYFGIGGFNEKAFTFNEMMGMAGSAYSDSSRVNIMNPAALSSLKNTVLQTSVVFRGSNLENTAKSQQYNDAWLDYFCVGFPVIQKRMGASFGLMPLSSTNYKIVDSTINSDIGDVVYKYNGKGKFYRTHLDFGLELMPEKFRQNYSFSVGAGFSYLFGYTEKQVRTEFNDTSYFLNSRRVEGLYMNEFYWDAGALFKMKIKEAENLTYQLSLSFGFDNGKDMQVKRDVYWDRYTNTYAGFDVKDTIKIAEGEEGLLHYPGGAHWGLAYQRVNNGPVGKLAEWLVAIDYKSRQWSKYEYFGQNPYLRNDYLLSLGGYLKPRSKKSAKPKTYYFGLHKGKTMLEINGEIIQKIGMSFGVGIPFRRMPGKAEQSSQLNLGLTLGKEGHKENGMIEESYIQINLGVLMNSRWFKKRKFN